MNIFQRAFKALQGLRFPQASAPWFLPRTKYDYKKDAGDGSQNSIVMAVTGWIARTFPEADLMVSRAKGPEWERQAAHPMLDLIDKPNPYYSGTVLWTATLLDWTISGNAYWVKLRNGVGRPVQLLYIPHSLMEPKWPIAGAKTTYISHYAYSPGEATQDIPLEDVIHFRRGLDPNNIRKGLSPLGSLFREIFTDDEAANFTATLLRNMGVPGVLITPEGIGGPSEDELKEAKEKFRDAFIGDHRGEPLIGKQAMKLTQFGYSPTDMNLQALRQIPEERITAIFGIPAAVVGLGTGLEQTKVGATMAEMREMAYESNIIPTQRLLATELGDQLLPDFESNPAQYRVAWDNSQVRVLQEDENNKAIRLNTMVAGGWLKVSEARQQMNLPIEPEHEIYLRPMMMIEVPAGKKPGVPAEEQLKALTTPLQLKEPRQQRLYRLLQRQIEGIETGFTKELARLFMDLGDQAERTYLERMPVPAGRGGNGQKATPTDEVVMQAILRAVDITSLEQGALKTAYEGSYRRTAEATFTGISSAFGLDVRLEDIVARDILEQGGKRIGLLDLAEDTKRGIFRALEAGRTEGESVRELGRRIQTSVAGGRYTDPTYRARLIARSEVKHAQNISSVAAYREAKVERLQAADAMVGDEHDPICLARDGRIFTLDEAAMEQETHPNCSLTWLPYLE